MDTVSSTDSSVDHLYLNISDILTLETLPSVSPINQQPECTHLLGLQVLLCMLLAANCGSFLQLLLSLLEVLQQIAPLHLVLLPVLHTLLKSQMQTYI